MDSERFNITAKEDEAVSVGRQKLPWEQYREQLGLMVQAMLADRFHLRVVRQPKEASILALVTAPGGPKLMRSARDSYEADFRGRRGQLIATGISIAQLADTLSWMPEVGSLMCVEGELRSCEYESNGVKVRTYDIVANSIINLSKGQRNA